jgi:hypothetical protein
MSYVAAVLAGRNGSVGDGGGSQVYRVFVTFVGRVDSLDLGVVQG